MSGSIVMASFGDGLPRGIQTILLQYDTTLIQYDTTLRSHRMARCALNRGSTKPRRRAREDRRPTRQFFAVLPVSRQKGRSHGLAYTFKLARSKGIMALRRWPHSGFDFFGRVRNSWCKQLGDILRDDEHIFQIEFLA